MEFCLMQTDMFAGCPRPATDLLGPAAALPRQINLPCRDRYSMGTAVHDDDHLFFFFDRPVS